MTFYIGKLLSLSCGKRSQCHSLIQFYIISDFCSLTYNHTGTMIDKEILSDGRSRVDIDSCTAMSIFRHHARDKWDLFFIKNMCQTIHVDSK